MCLRVVYLGMCLRVVYLGSFLRVVYGKKVVDKGQEKGRRRVRMILGMSWKVTVTRFLVWGEGE
jgi:hypothetical protein